MVSGARHPKVLVVQVAALGGALVREFATDFSRLGLQFGSLQPPMPAVTCTAQAVFRTGLAPAETGIAGNGRFDRTTRKTDFWNQSARLVQGGRIWDEFRADGGTVGVMFWQQSLGEGADLIVSPAPIHKHHGGMIQSLYTVPETLEQTLIEAVGRKFNLMHYWGPLASAKAGEWICQATAAVLADPALRPDVLLTYVPNLDYVLQKHGPDSPKVAREVQKLVAQLDVLLAAAKDAGYATLVWGDYAIEQAKQVVLPNLALHKHDLFATRTVKGMLYPDLYQSRAFAMVDHQVAEVYVPDASDREQVRQVLANLPGVASVEAGQGGEFGDLRMVAEHGAWLAYPWWADRCKAPDYATHVDIHSKPGYDPGELFSGFPPLVTVSLKPEKVQGTHGRNDLPACYAWSDQDTPPPASLPELAAQLRERLNLKAKP
ncbi:MAG: alkaline phosphatase family protein [Victivallales bacterium]|nr:alkaline phosphatase family protein [Victivallales bacterium]